MIDIKGLIETRLRAYDPLIDLSENGFAQELIIKPIVKAFGSDPMTTDIRTFLISKFNELYPNTTLSNGDAVSDILISVGQLFFEAYRLELQNVKNSLSIDYLDQMSDGDANALAANWLVSRRIGTKASGSIRVVVNRLSTISINTTNVVRASNGFSFLPSNFETIDTSLLLVNRLANGNYYFDLNVTALQEGTLGNISAGGIVSIANINGLVSVSNDVAFSGGSDTEDNQALLRDRLPRSATERSLVTKRGISARIENYTSSVNSVEVVGFGDIEMTRDAVDFQNHGAFKAFGVAYAIGRLVFLTLNDPKISILETDIIRSTDGTKFSISTVISEQNNAVLMDSGKSFIVYTDVDAGLGKALLVNLESTPVVKIGEEVFTNEVHLGGKADVYIEPSFFTDLSTTFSQSEFESIYSGFGFEVIGNKIIIPTILNIGNGLFIQTDDGVFKILHAIIDGNKTNIFIGQDLENGVFVSFWKILGKLSISISNKETTVLNFDEGVIGTITETGIVLLNRDVSVIVNIGDIIVLQDATRFRIVAIFGDRLETEQRPVQPILNVPIKFIKVATTSILPASDIFNINVSNKTIGSNRCLGLEPINVYGAKTLSRGTGFVSRCLLDMFISPEGESRAQLPLVEFSKSSFRIRHLRRDKLQVLPEYNVDARFDLGEYGGGYGYLDEDMSVAIFVGGKSSIEFWDGDEPIGFPLQFSRMFYLEVPLFNDMLVDGANNVFIALGDGVTDYEFPIFNFLRGNILRIDDGLNKGNYIIDKVLNIRLPNNFEDLRPVDDHWRKPIAISGNIQINENGFGNERYSVYTITYNLNSSQASNALFKNISIVKIKGRFPVNPFDILNSQIDPSIIVRNISRNELFPANPPESDQGLNLLDFSRLNDIFINQIKSTTIKTILNSDATLKVFELINSKFRGVLGGLNEITQFNDAFLEKLYKVQYTYGSPAKGEANLFLEDNVVTRLRPVPTQKYLISDINNGVRNRVDKKSPAIKILKDLRDWFYAEKNKLTLVLADEASFSVIGDGSVDNKKTWKRGLDIERVSVSLFQNFTPVGGRTDLQADIVKFDNALEIISEYGEASINVCKELFVQKRFVRSVDQVFLPYIPIHVPNQAFRNALVAVVDIFSANDVTNTQEFINCANRLNGDGIKATDLVNYYLALGTYVFLKIDQATYEQDPESIKNLPLSVEAVFQNTAFLPGNNYDERNNFWKDSTDVQASDLMFYGYLDDDTEITGITLAEVSKLSNELRLVSPISDPSTTYSFNDSLLSADIYVERNGELLDIYNADDYDQQTGVIKLTKPMAFTTPRIYNVGRIFYTVDNELVIYGFQGIQFGEDNVFTYIGNLRSQGNESGVLLDITRSFLTDNDVGRFITIFNYVQSPEYTGVNGIDAFVPIRQHIGCYKILGVDSIVRRSQFTGKDVIVSQKLTIADFPNLLSFKGFNRLQADDTEPLALAFVITDAPEVTPIVNDDGTTSITTLLPVQIYARNATSFDIVASALNNKSVGVKIIADNSVPSIDKVEPFLFVNNMNNLNMSFNKNNPFIVSTRSFLTLDTYETIGGMYAAKIKFQSLGLEDVYNLIQGEGFDTYNEEIDGYRIISKDLDVARTTKESLYLEIPPRVFDVSPLSSDITIKSATNFAISVVESIFASDERIVCSNTLVKEKVRSYLGADIRYVGNVLENTVVEAIIKVFNNALLSNTPISISSLVQYLHRLGVSRVIMPIRLYHIVVDLDRRVYYRPIKDVLHPNTDLDILATARLLMTLVPSYNQTIHGAKIVATRVLDTTLIG